MGLIREPKNVDFTMESKPWTNNELLDFRKLMKEINLKNKKEKSKRHTRVVSNDKEKVIS